MHSRLRCLRVLGAAVAVSLGLGGCGKPAPVRSQSEDVRATSSPIPSGGARVPTRSTDERRAELLNRIRAADPNHATIERALINDDHDLGIVLTRTTDLDDIPRLMKPLLAELDKAFPGEDHTIVAYAPTSPPRKIGTARLNARTRDMTYTRETP